MAPEKKREKKKGKKALELGRNKTIYPKKLNKK